MAYIPDYRSKRPNLSTKKKYNNTDIDRPKDPFYRTNRWKVRSVQQRNEFPYCAACKEQGIILIGDVTDHIIPIKQHGDPWDQRNLQTLCDTCHNRKRQKEARGIYPPSKVNEFGFKIPL